MKNTTVHLHAVKESTLPSAQRTALISMGSVLEEIRAENPGCNMPVKINLYYALQIEIIRQKGYSSTASAKAGLAWLFLDYFTGAKQRRN